MVAGLLGSFGHSVPGVAGVALGLWYDSVTLVGLLGVLMIILPTIAYAILAAVTFVVLGGPPSGADTDIQPDHS